MQLIPKLLSITLCLSGSLLARAAKPDSLPYHWYYYILDSTEQYNGEARIRFDSKGVLKVGYQGRYVAKYGELVGHRFRTETADTSFTAGGSKVDMDLDAEGRPHIVYHDWGYSRINYAFHDGTKWGHRDFGPLGLDLLDFYQVGIAVDNKGTAHITYPATSSFDSTGKPKYLPSLAYITYDKDRKKSDSVFLGGSGLQGKYTSLLLDANESPVSSLYNFDGSNLTVAYRKDGKWTHQVIDSSQFLNSKGFYNSIAALPGNRYTIAYQNHSLHKVQVAEGTLGGTWTMKDIDTLKSYTSSSCKNPIATDADGVQYLAYARMEAKGDNDVQAVQLVLATKKDSVWTYQVVDEDTLTGEYATIAVNPVTKLPAIGYYDRGKKRLKVAVARKEAPTDTNSNGIPDYQEIPPTGLRKSPKALKRTGALKPGRTYDAGGRSVPMRPEAPGKPAAAEPMKILFGREARK